VARAKSTATKAPAIAAASPAEQEKSTTADMEVKTTAETVPAQPAAAEQSVAAEPVKISEPETAPVVTVESTPPNTAPEDMGVVTIRTKRGIQSFRRAGYTFTREPKAIAIADLTAEQAEALANEPRLEIEECSVEHSDAGAE